MKNPKISVIMSEYNTKPKYFDIAIKSILDQTFKDFELIIVDDCGSNDVKRIASKFNDRRIRVIKNRKNLGFGLALNVGIKNSKGKYIVRMDTDDISTVNRVKVLYEYIEANPQYDIVGSRAIEFHEGINLGITGIPGEKYRNNIIRGDMLVHGSVIMNKKAVDSVGGYKDSRRAQDFILWCDLLLDNKRLFALNDILYEYRVNPGDYSKRKLKNRKDEIRAKLLYFPKLDASYFEYSYILKSIVAGILPIFIVRFYRKKFVLSKINNDSTMFEQ